MVNLKFMESGAFGSIYKVVDEETADKLDIKEPCDKNTCIKTCSLEAGSKEFEILRRIQHTNIIKCLFGYYDFEMNIYVLGIQLMQGDVFKYRKEVKIKQFINQVMDGIVYLHSHNIIHADIKPQNILIRKIGNDHHYCITDFNTAYVYKSNNKHLKFKTIENKIMGTINFCSLFVLLHCQPYRRDDLESLFITCLFLTNKDINESLFTTESNEKTLRKFRLCMNEYSTIKYLRSLYFFQDIEYDDVKQLIINDLT